MSKDSRLENQEKWTGKSGDGWSVAKFRERIRARLVNVFKVRRGVRKFWSSSRSTAAEATTRLVSTQAGCRDSSTQKQLTDSHHGMAKRRDMISLVTQ